VLAGHFWLCPRVLVPQPSPFVHGENAARVPALPAASSRPEPASVEIRRSVRIKEAATSYKEAATSYKEAATSYKEAATSYKEAGLCAS